MKKVLSLVVTVAVASLPFAGPSAAGGFCGDGRFEDIQTNSVRMSKMCFEPTVVRVDRGETVTWTNLDPEFHALGGVAGSFGELHSKVASDETISYEFTADGVYPYVCVLHPGMAGAVVVGDGVGKATAASVRRVPSNEQTALDTSARSLSAGDGTEIPLLALTAALIGVATVAVVWIPRRRRRAAAA